MEAIGDQLERRPRPYLLPKHILDTTHPKVLTRQNLGAVAVTGQHPSLPREMHRVGCPQIAQTRKRVLLELGRSWIINHPPPWRLRVDHSLSFLADVGPPPFHFHASRPRPWMRSVA